MLILNIAIVVSEFNNKVTSRMHKVELEKAKELKLKVKYECNVPGVLNEEVNCFFGLSELCKFAISVMVKALSLSVIPVYVRLWFTDIEKVG